MKRAAFATAAALAVHDKTAPDERFLAILPLIEREAGDDRNFVKKAVNWALRNIGKRNAALHAAAIETAEAILAAADARAAADRARPGRAQRPLGRPRRAARAALREGAAPLLTRRGLACPATVVLWSPARGRPAPTGTGVTWPSRAHRPTAPSSDAIRAS